MHTSPPCSLVCNICAKWNPFAAGVSSETNNTISRLSTAQRVRDEPELFAVLQNFGPIEEILLLHHLAINMSS